MRPFASVVVLGIMGGLTLGVLGCEQVAQLTKTFSKEPAQPSAPSPASQAAGGVLVPDQERVALVNQTPISTTDVELGILELKRFVQAVGQSWQSLPVEERADALDLSDVMNNLVDVELKSQDARARGLDRKSDVQRRFAYLQRGFYGQEWDRWQRERSAPTEEAIHQFYEQNKLGFMDPERIRARQIVSPTLAEAEAVRTQVVQGGVFAQLAREKSIGAGKEKGGDIGWHLRAVDRQRLQLIGKTPTEEVFFPQLESVAFTLELNQVSQPVKGPEGRYYLVTLEERKPARQQTELEVHDAIKEMLTVQNMQKQLEQLRANATVERFPDRLQHVQQ